MIRRIVLGIAMGASLLSGAFPSPDGLKRAQPNVLALMKDEERALREHVKSRSDVAVAAMKFAADSTRSEAEKFLLMKGAFSLYLRDGAHVAACETLEAIWLAVVGFDDARREHLVETELRRLPKDAARAFRAEQAKWQSLGERLFRSGAVGGLRKVEATATTPEAWYIGHVKLSEDWQRNVVDDVTKFGVRAVRECQQYFNVCLKDKTRANLDAVVTRFPGMSRTGALIASFAQKEASRGNVEECERLSLLFLEEYGNTCFTHGAPIAPNILRDLKSLYRKVGRNADANALERKYGWKYGGKPPKSR